MIKEYLASTRYSLNNKCKGVIFVSFIFFLLIPWVLGALTMNDLDKDIVHLSDAYQNLFLSQTWLNTLFLETILFNLCGHGHFDMQAYTDYFAGNLEDRNYDEQELAMALAGLPSVAA